MRCRRGRALIGLKRFSAAAEALERGLDLLPGDSSLSQVRELTTYSLLAPVAQQF